MKRRFLILAFTLLSIAAMAQVAINTDSSLPDNSAMLDMKSITKGLLMPRMTQTQRNAIVTPAAGLTIFQTDNTPGIYFNSGTSAVPVWVMAGSGSGGAGTGWSTTGNGATNPAINFIGTTDDNDLIFKRNTEWAGLIGSNNTALGRAALNSGSTGMYNAVFGNDALTLNTTGYLNVAMGAYSLLMNTSGNYNSAAGAMALSSNSTGLKNTAFGSEALYSNRGGNNATAIGTSAMQYANDQLAGFTCYSVAVGFEALRGSSTAANNTGNWNTALGYQTLLSNTTGSNNTASGAYALYSNSTGNNNTATGINALFSNTTGSQNSASGKGALYTNLTGTSNTAYGFQSLNKNSDGSYNCALGFNALVSNTTTDSNTALGAYALQSNTTGSNNVAVGYAALSSLTTGSNNIGIGYNAQVPLAIANNQVRLGNTSIAYAGIQVAWTITSDRRLKTEIKNSELGLGFIKKLNPVSYIRINDTGKKTEYGFIAQEVEETLKNLGLSNTGMVSKDDKGMYSVRYNDLFAPLVKAVQEQQVVIEGYQEKINVANAKITSLEEINKQQLEVNKQLENRLKAIEAKLK